MYKDVKKKLIALVLSICMVATVIEVVPIVRAATDTTVHTINTFKVSVDGIGTPKKVTVKYEGNSFDYNGESQCPKLKEVIIDKEGDDPAVDITQYCSLQVDGDHKDASTTEYNCYLVGSNGYSFDKNETKIPFKINQVTVKKLEVIYDNQKVNILNQDKIKPAVNNVNAILSDGSSILLSYDSTNDNNSDYTIADITETGLAVPCKITLKGGANTNFTSSVEETIKCKVAYDLNGNYKYFLDFNGRKDSAEYTGSTISPEIHLYETADPQTNKLKIDSTYCDIKINGSASTTVREAGQYTFTAKPKNGSAMIQIGSFGYFTGTFSKVFTVGKKDAASNLTVYCKN